MRESWWFYREREIDKDFKINEEMKEWELG